MILGREDRERVTTAEVRVASLQEQLEHAQGLVRAARRDHANAEARVLAQVAQNERLTAWGQGLAVEAGRMVDDAHADRDAAFRVLLDLAGELRGLHVEADAAPVCRHCGHAYPCPTLAVLPSPA